MERRNDRITALLIEAVLNAQAAHGRVRLANAFNEIGVPLHMAMRLLTRPHERRNYSELANDPTVR